ncbi:surface-adhesin E family protein [Noviherbaspirillum humi]|uniref:surface-adhesin E family protein n=1 Tax=Noviherbaspirillum humi TaxID=1688639 RepID=UPI0011603798|nr:surface-adhesin E family protein [Noviherbaspirillum humi]
MKKALLPNEKLLLIAVFATAPAWASWTQVATHDAADVYVDLATVESVGNSKQLWMLANFKERGQGGELSLRSHIEIDCSQHATRQLKGFGHDEAMGKGQMMFSVFKPGDWKEIEGTTGDAVMKVVCSS